MPRALQISDSEWAVMEPIWQQGVCTAAEVINRLAATHDWNHSTIRTLLARLLEKGCSIIRSTVHDISIAPPSRGNSVCARKAASF